MVPPLKTRIGSLLTVFALPRDDPDLARAQLVAFSKQMPLLHAIMVLNVLELAATHLRSSPLVLSVVLPLCLCLGCCLRCGYWLRVDFGACTGAEAITQLRTTMRIAGLLTLAFSVWPLCLLPYGDTYARCQVVFYMAIMMLSGSLCLIQMRGAAQLVTAIMLAHFTIFFVATGNPVLIAMTVNTVLVTCGLAAVILRNYKDFTGLILTHRVMLERQTEMQRLSDENHHLANSDVLTGLPNRRSFLMKLDEMILAAGTGPGRFAVALLDLDGFKSVNDVYGHAAGDKLLAEVGQRMKALAAPRAFFARLGGDEFGIILTGFGSDADIVAFGQQVLSLFRAPCHVNGATVVIAGSIGVAILSEGGATGVDLFERADYALYYVKQTRKGQVVIFTESHEEVVRRHSRIEQALRRADLGVELEMVYQPIIDTMTSRVIAFEALARWNSPDIGPVCPTVFLPIAERRQLMGKMTEILLVKALQVARPWPRHIMLCFNLSAADVMSPETMAAVEAIVLRSGIEPSRVEFEITETTAMKDFAQVVKSITLLRALGARIALDDFGSGFSSLGRLLLLKVDKIKLDQSFVKDIGRSRVAPSIVRSVVGLCDDLGLDCVAEGVETESQRAILQGLGCRWMQGYLFGEPLSARNLARLLVETDDRAEIRSPDAVHLS